MSRTLLTRGGGMRGHYLEFSAVAATTMDGELDVFKAAGTQIISKFVYLSYGANYEVDSPAAGARVDGKIKVARYDDLASAWRLTVQIWSFADDQGNVYPAMCIENSPYNGTVALGNSLECNATATYYMYADGDTDGFRNMLISLDVPASGYCDVIHG